jgi:hypothetical protein
MACQVWASIEDGAAVRDPALLCRFSALCFADLKKNRYVYWCVVFLSSFLSLNLFIHSYRHVLLCSRLSDATFLKSRSRFGFAALAVSPPYTLLRSVLTLYHHVLSQYSSLPF